MFNSLCLWTERSLDHSGILTNSELSEPGSLWVPAGKAHDAEPRLFAYSQLVGTVRYICDADQCAARRKPPRGRSAAAENGADDDSGRSGNPQYLPGVIPDELIGGIDRALGLVGYRLAGIDQPGLGLAEPGFEIRSGLCQLVGAGSRDVADQVPGIADHIFEIPDEGLLAVFDSSVGHDFSLYQYCESKRQLPMARQGWRSAGLCLPSSSSQCAMSVCWRTDARAWPRRLDSKRQKRLSRAIASAKAPPPGEGEIKCHLEQF